MPKEFAVTHQLENKMVTRKWFKYIFYFFATLALVEIYGLFKTGFKIIYSSTLSNLILFAAIALCARWAFKRIPELKRIQTYYSLIVKENIYTLEDLALKTGVSKATVERELNCMIEYGYFEGAYIFREAFLVPGIREEIEAVCPNCGATKTIISGEVVECEYCGSNIS